MWQVEFTEKLKRARPDERKWIFVEYAALTGYSRPHLYRIAKQQGFDTGRERSDKGKLKSELADEQVKLIAALLHTTRRENKGSIMPVKRAIQVAVDSGIIEEGQISEAGMNRILRERQMSKRHQKAPAIHAEMRSLHPNHTHVFDVSVCIQYYLKDGALSFIDERDYYKNKPDNFAKIKTRLLRYVIVDHFSGAFYCKYYNTTGETQDNLYDFLKEAWGKKDNDKVPFHGVPFNLLMDTGAANKSKAIVGMLERMDVNIPKGNPYNPRRQGAVETMHNVIEGWFESGLRIQPATSVEEINAWAIDFMAWFQATQEHTRHRMPRNQCWTMIRREELRELPAEDIIMDLFANPEEDRMVDGTYCISYRGNIYNLKHIEGLFRGAKVQAVLKPWKWPVIDVIYQGKVYEATHIEVLPAHLGGFRADAAIIGQEYKPQPETLTQQAEKVFENMAYGEDRKKDSIPFEGLKVFGHHADKVESIAFIEKQGTPLEVDRGITERAISMVEFFKRLKNAIGAIPPELNRELRAKYGDSIDVKEAEEVIRRLSEGGGEDVKTASA